MVVTNTVTRATQTGQYLDLAAIGQKTVICEICIHTIRDGRIAKTVQATMDAGMYHQLTGRVAPSSLDNMG